MTDPHAPAETPLTKREFVALRMLEIGYAAFWADPVLKRSGDVAAILAEEAFFLADAFLEEGAKGNDQHP